MIFSIDTSDAVNFKRLSKDRTSMPRLRIVPATDHKHVVNFGAAGIAHAKAQVKKFAARRLGKDKDEITFSDNVQLDFDRAVTGKTFLDNFCTDNNVVH